MKNSFFSLFEYIITLINTVISVIIALAVLGFMWGVVKILFNPENEIVKKEGRSFMLYGLVTLFVMTSVWGLVNIFEESFFLGVDRATNEEYSEEILSPEKQFPPIQDAGDVFDNNLEQRAI